MQELWGSVDLGWESSLALTLTGYARIFFIWRDRDSAKGRMCKHQTTDVLKIYSGKNIGENIFRALKQVKYNRIL